jgi:hypothetical protein
VQGNLITLNIGEDAIPWRIISTKINDDHSYDLGCVRNPDFIYPHTRAGERDIILPPYIPKWSGILYPANDIDLSLYPPSHAYIGGDPIISPLDPPGATDPTGGTGGGVGDQNGDQNQNPITVPPPQQPPPVILLDDYIQVDRVDYVVQNNMVNATITFRQPDNPTYAGVDFWYKRNISTETVYRTASSATIAGANANITHTFTGLIKSAVPYELVARVRYSNNNSSTFKTTVFLNVAGVISTENPVDYESVVGSGWSLPTQAANNPRDTIFSSLSAVASLNGSSDRLLAFTVNQDINNPSGYNGEVSGMNIYYRLTGTTYFKKYNHAFDGSYFPSQAYTFTPGLDLGIGTPSPDDASDNFDFVFRFTYRDGTESTKQWRYMGADVQPTSGDPFGAVFKFYENNTDFVFQTEDQAPPGEVVDTRNITVGLTDGALLANPNRLTITINPPAVADRVNWYGVRVRYRKVPLAGGVAPEFDRLDFFPVPQPVSGVWQFRITPLDFNEVYQIIITPVVRYSGSRTEANSSWIGEGRLDPSVTGNQITRLGFRTIESAQIPEITAEPFPTGNPKALVKSWKKLNSGSGSYAPLYQYYELEYNVSHVTNLSSVKIYRRSNNGNALGPNPARHFGLGRWEEITVVPGTNATTLGNGNVLVNLRHPVSSQEFDPYYLTNSTAPLLRTTVPWSTKKIVAAEFVDFVIVVTTTTGVSEYGMLLPRIVGNTQTTTALAQEVLVSQYDNHTAGYKRNITLGTDGSIANRTTDLNVTATIAYTAPTPLRGSGIL